ncbi:MAG: TIGR03663 family protein [Chloroflexi bacterium]|nr:TIGR03663 family protein [Chloroflexota bacterium]
MAKLPDSKTQSWLDRPLVASLVVNWETLLFAAILILAVISRFYDLGARVMSHDETSHVYFSWQLFKGNGYAHSPLTHGPLQFHLISLSYFLFGDSDFSARFPAALFSVAIVGFAWAFRRYIGRIGAMIAAALLLISPYMLYYGRYARNEAYVGLFGLVTLWAILRYLDLGENKYLYFLTAATALHFAAKETSFIYAAQGLLFLGFLFLVRVSRHQWPRPEFRRRFLYALYAVLALAVITVGVQWVQAKVSPGVVSGAEVLEPVVAGDPVPVQSAAPVSPIVLVSGGLAGLALIAGLAFLVRGYGWEQLRKERSFGLMVLIFTLVLPHLAAFPIRFINPDHTYSYYVDLLSRAVQGSGLSAQEAGSLIPVALMVLALFGLSALLGMLWSRRVWLTNVAIFYVIFVPLFSTMFTNLNGLFTGLVGSLGYWLEQQGVQRGSQPSYYYWGVQIPIYEYLAATGTLLAAWMGVKLLRRKTEPPAQNDAPDRNLRPHESRRLALIFFAFWAVTSLIAYTVAGEKMPWLTYHIALPMILLSGWAFSRLIQRIDWARWRLPRTAFAVILVPVFILALLGALVSLLGANPPFQGPQQTQLLDTYEFVFRIIVVLASGYGLWRLREELPDGQLSAVAGLVVIIGMALLTIRTSMRAAFINYDDATEYLVYAHMARGPKEIMEQVDELSQRINDGNTMVVAYDNETSYPFWWYLRNYPNQRYYGETPSRDLRDAPIIIVGDANYSKIEPIVGNGYNMFEYIRIWWPNQDYFDFQKSSVSYDYSVQTGQPAETMNTINYLPRALARVWGYLDTGAERAAVYNIWMDRDFSDYFAARGQSFDMTNWNPSRTMRLYVRKDVVAQIWEYGVEPAAGVEIADPYEDKGIELPAALSLGEAGSGPLQFNAPRGLALAPDGSLYVADAFNHRIQHIAADGTLIRSWGSQSATGGESPEPGSFNEPWGVAVSPDGEFVYVADTWNHRIQKFTSGGRYLTSWGVFAQGSDPYSMYGPRDVAVDADGNVLVTDTGNKRITVYDANGEYINQYGVFGFDLGSFDEPVGIAVDLANNRLYVADTWNQRVQVIAYSDGVFEAVDAWDISGWFGQSLENKPYLAVGGDRLYISDPEAGRVLVYNFNGELQYFWGGFDQTAVLLGITQGIAADADGNVWVSDSQNNRVLLFKAP